MFKFFSVGYFILYCVSDKKFIAKEVEWLAQEISEYLNLPIIRDRYK
jgi:hypothetical protein